MLGFRVLGFRGLRFRVRGLPAVAAVGLVGEVSVSVQRPKNPTWTSQLSIEIIISDAWGSMSINNTYIGPQCLQISPRLGYLEPATTMGSWEVQANSKP